MTSSSAAVNLRLVARRNPAEAQTCNRAAELIEGLFADMDKQDAEITTLRARVAELESWLSGMEAFMSIVEPRSNKADYLRVLEQLRTLLAVKRDA